MSPRQQHLHALANECRVWARALRAGGILAAIACLFCVCTGLPGWAIVMGCFVFAFEFLGAVARHDYRTLCQYLTRNNP